MAIPRTTVIRNRHSLGRSPLSHRRCRSARPSAATISAAASSVIRARRRHALLDQRADAAADEPAQHERQRERPVDVAGERVRDTPTGAVVVMTNALVAVTTCGGMRAAISSSGISTTPPPMPNSDEKKPMPSPATTPMRGSCAKVRSAASARRNRTAAHDENREHDQHDAVGEVEPAGREALHREDADDAAGHRAQTERHREPQVDDARAQVAERRRAGVREHHQQRRTRDLRRRHAERDAQHGDDDEAAAQPDDRAEDARRDADGEQFERAERRHRARRTRVSSGRVRCSGGRACRCGSRRRG